MHRTTTIFLFAAIGLLNGGAACVDAENFRADVINCEDALSHALACCPGLAPPDTACVYHHESGSGSCGCTRGGEDYHEETRTPVLMPTRADTIASATCAELSMNDGCAALARELSANNLSGYDIDCNGNRTEF